MLLGYGLWENFFCTDGQSGCVLMSNYCCWEINLRADVSVAASRDPIYVLVVVSSLRLTSNRVQCSALFDSLTHWPKC